ncbi:carbohydrate ABC transporter permease [Labrys neptuniae]
MAMVTPHRNLGRSFAWLVLWLFVIGSLFPLWIALKTAFTPLPNLYDSAGSPLPGSLTTSNFTRIFGLSPDEGGFIARINFGPALLNSLVFTAVCVSGQILFSSLAAYAFARLRFFGRDVIFYLFISATMVPAIVLFIPNFVLIKELGWLNTMTGMVAPFVLMTPFAVFFLRQFFLSTPSELEDAARLDGASPLRIFWSVVLPVHRGAIATLAILLGINSWNEFLWPYLVGRDENSRVLSVALTNFLQQQPNGNPDWTGLMAATFLSILPVIALLVILGRRVVESLQFSGLK